MTSIGAASRGFICLTSTIPVCNSLPQREHLKPLNVSRIYDPHLSQNFMYHLYLGLQLKSQSNERMILTSSVSADTRKELGLLAPFDSCPLSQARSTSSVIVRVRVIDIRTSRADSSWSRTSLGKWSSTVHAVPIVRRIRCPTYNTIPWKNQVPTQTFLGCRIATVPIT